MPRSPVWNDPTNNLSASTFKTVGSDRCIPVSRAEETALFRRYRAGDKTALDEIVRANLRWALTQARSNTNRGLPLEDVFAAAQMGLLIAAEKFDPDKGYKFISYAVWWIKQHINKEVTDHRRTIRMHPAAEQLIPRQTAIRHALSQRLGRIPTRTEVADEYRAQHGEVPSFWDAAQAAYSGSVSIDDVIDADGTPLDGHGIIADAETLDPADTIQADEAQAAIKAALAGLPEREADIIALHYGLLGTEPHTLERIGQIYHLTRERVRQLRNRGLEMLKKRCPHLATYCAEL